MILITEEITEAKYLVEADDKGHKNYFIEGIFMQTECKNKNGRFYPKSIVENEVGRYNKEYISQNRAFGELGHPSGPGINLDRVSHIIKELYPDGNNFMGKAKILDTPFGKIVKSMLDEGVQLGVSSRGVGTLKPGNGYSLVQDDFKLAAAADIVADPSAPNAFVRGIMEGKAWVYESGIWKEESIEEAKVEIKKVSRYAYETKALELFERFIDNQRETPQEKSLRDNRDAIDDDRRERESKARKCLTDTYGRDKSLKNSRNPK